MTNQISDHFTWDEANRSLEAARKGVKNTIPDDIKPVIQRTASEMEKVREMLGGKSISVLSWYRSPLVNQMVGGASKSAHLKGFAVDFRCDGAGTVREVARKIQSSAIMFDQVICEFPESPGGGWVHISFDPRNRRQVLTARKVSGKTIYSDGVL